MTYHVHITSPTSMYVAWIDLMGGGRLMSRSLSALAGAIATLNEACIAAAGSEIELHPLNDGVFALAPDRDAILTYLSQAFGNLAAAAISATAPEEVRLVRGSLAFGEALTMRHTYATHASSVVLGTPKSEAFRAEDTAAPFGVCVHVSAVAAGVPTDWRWYTDPPTDLIAALDLYFAWARSSDAYPPDKRHRVDEHHAQMQAHLATRSSG